jgi:hypothetical protein
LGIKKGRVVVDGINKKRVTNIWDEQKEEATTTRDQ